MENVLVKTKILVVIVIIIKIIKNVNENDLFILNDLFYIFYLSNLYFHFCFSSKLLF